MRALAANPVVMRDARSMFRERRIVAAQLGYLLALIVAMVAAALMLYGSGLRTGAPGAGHALAEFGRWMFIGIAEVQVVLILLIVVAYSAASISLEREKQTYETLAITSLTSLEVVAGKVTSVTVLCYLLMLTSLPLAACCFLFGGVSPGDVAASYLMLAIKVPLWASLGVLTSVIVGRSMAAYVTTLVAVAGENYFSIMLMEPGRHPPVAMGLFSPFLAPAAQEFSFELLGLAVPAWLLPVPYAGLLTALAMVGSAEAMLHYRPKRSPLLRALLLAVTFYMAFLFAALVIGRSVGSKGALPVLNILLMTWLWACVFVPIFTSYEPKPGSAGARDLARAAIDPKRWLDREAASGGGFCLFMWLVALLGAFAAVLVALLKPHGGVSVPAYLTNTPALGLALIIYALSIIAYSACGTVLAVVNKSRREVSLATMLLILFVNSGAAYASGVHIMRKVPRAAPAVLASPAAAGSAVLAQGLGHSLWRRYSLDEAVVYGLGYPLLLLAGARWYYRRNRGRAEASDADRTRADAAAEKAPP